MRRTILTLIFCMLSYLQFISAQAVWPGDVNNNGVVNAVDVLYWGIAHEHTGPERLEESTDWEAHSLPELWPQNFPSGINYAYADCNGDGIVDEEDFDKAIDDNFGLEYGTPGFEGYSNGTPGAAPRLRLQPSTTIALEGDTVNIALSLDDMDMPIDNFYGIALTISYTTGLLEGDDGPDFDLTEDSWLEADDSYVQELFVDNDGQGQAELAVTRTNQIAIPIDEEGGIGQISVVIEDIIVGLYLDTFRLQIDSVLLITDDLMSIPVVPDSVEIVVTKDIKFTIIKQIAGLEKVDEFSKVQNISVFPNPAKEGFYLKSIVPLIDQPYMVDYLGRVLPVEVDNLNNGLYRLQHPSLPPGIYWLHVRSEVGEFIQKIVLTP